MVSFTRAYARATPAARATCDGMTSDVVDVYDAATNVWSVAHLTVPRAIVVGASAGDWASFAAGNAHTEATKLYALSGACTGPPPFPGGWHWRERDDVKKWGAEISKTKEAKANLARTSSRAEHQRRACEAGPYRSAVGNRTLDEMDEATLETLEGAPELLAAGCSDFGGDAVRPTSSGRGVNTCEKILANEVDLWRAGKRVRATDDAGDDIGDDTGDNAGAEKYEDEDKKNEDVDEEDRGGLRRLGEWTMTRIPLGRAHISSAGLARPGGGATFVYAAGSAKTRWKPFNRHKTLSRVDIMHID